MEKIDFKDRIQSNPRLLRLKNPSTGEIIDYEIQDLLEGEIVQDGTEVSSNVLNEMQDNIEESCVVVSPIEPTTNEKVWIQKGKNLFDKSKFQIEYAWQVTTTINDDKSIIVNNTGTSGVSFIRTNKYKLNAGTYTFNANIVGQLQNIKIYNSSELLKESSNTTITFTLTDDDYVYIEFYIWATDASNSMKISNIQIEQGITATEYEAYVERKINVKNDNGGYEEFYDESKMNKTNYSTAEQIIGTWIDGKPLYRKTIQKSFVDNWTTLYLNDINADTIYINYGKTFANFKIDNTYYSNGQFYISETDFFRTFIANKNELLVAFASAMTEREATITIEYTKTTDA